jgi:hypothetical protein
VNNLYVVDMSYAAREHMVLLRLTFRDVESMNRGQITLVDVLQRIKAKHFLITSQPHIIGRYESINQLCWRFVYVLYFAELPPAWNTCSHA